MLDVWRKVFVVVACGLAILTVPASQASDAPPSIAPFNASGLQPIESALAAAQASADARYLGNWIQARNDSGGLPFAIVDKKEARLYVFDDRQALVASTVVLTGAMPGDQSLPGVGLRAQTSRLARHERTTPAGRYPSVPGRNLTGEDIVWFDYPAALAIHRLRPGASLAERERRLASATTHDNRTSLGCVVVPVAFYDSVVRPWLGTRRGVVYVLPDDQPVQDRWPGDAPMMARNERVQAAAEAMNE